MVCTGALPITMTRWPRIGIPLRVRSTIRSVIQSVLLAHIAQSVERVLGKNEVSGSTPDVGSPDTCVDPVRRLLDGTDLLTSRRWRWKRAAEASDL